MATTGGGPLGTESLEQEGMEVGWKYCGGKREEPVEVGSEGEAAM